ncbi:MAG: tetratricopeptide repeat protein [Verrucomicrobia bacterium]|nr:tetratricopeptide repeat protein [Verrucomicrobiota bacterium]
MFGFSDDTLLHMYDLANSLVNKGKYDNASDLFRLLTILAPHVTSYWIGLGFCRL